MHVDNNNMYACMPHQPSASQNSSEHPPLATPPDQAPLSQHPFELWQQAAANPRDADMASLDMIANTHNESSGGYGYYWMGRAIIQLSYSGKAIQNTGAVKSVMDRWRRDGYGTDTARYQQRIANHDSKDDSSAGPRGSTASRSATGKPPGIAIARVSTSDTNATGHRPDGDG
jgi:hypothetical protein